MPETNKEGIFNRTIVEAEDADTMNLPPEITEITDDTEKSFIAARYAELIDYMVKKEMGFEGKYDEDGNPIMKKKEDYANTHKNVSKKWGSFCATLAKNIYEEHSEHMQALQELDKAREDASIAEAATQEAKETHPLTRLVNGVGAERAFNKIREMESNVELEGQTVAVRMDLDGFRALNSLLGHSGADKMLIKFSQLLPAMLREALREALGDTVRQTDVCVHFSGDEFGLILTDVKAARDEETQREYSIEETVEMILKRVMKKIESVKIPVPEHKEITINLNASVGYVLVEKGSGETFKEIDMKADETTEVSKGIKTAKGNKQGDSETSGEYMPGSERVVGYHEKGAVLEKFGITKADAIASNFRSKTERGITDLMTAAREAGMNMETVKRIAAQWEKLCKEIREIPTNEGG